MTDWDAPWAAVVGKAREDWEVVVSAGSLELDERLMQTRLNFIQDVWEEITLKDVTNSSHQGWRERLAAAGGGIYMKPWKQAGVGSSNSMERVVMGDTYSYCNDTSKLKHVQVVEGFQLCVFLGQTSARLTLRPEYRRSSAGDAFFCVQLLLKREATKPSSVNAGKTHLERITLEVHATWSRMAGLQDLRGKFGSCASSVATG